MTYAQYSKGYRAGGLTQLSGDPSQPPLFPYTPELSHNFEVGSKHAWLQEKVRLNISLFFTTVADVQVPTLVLPEAITVIRNSGKLQSKGVELEAIAQPVKGLILQYNAGLVDASYTSLNLPRDGEVVNLDGNKQIFTPDRTSFVALQYSLPVSVKKRINLVARGEWLHLGKQYFDLANNIVQSPYSRFNSRAGFTSPHFEAFFWARNISDKAYIEYAYDFGGVHLGNPRTIGVSVRANF
jgi:iron complex outermembrane receptor protein